MHFQLFIRRRLSRQVNSSNSSNEYHRIEQSNIPTINVIPKLLTYLDHVFENTGCSGCENARRLCKLSR